MYTVSEDIFNFNQIQNDQESWSFYYKLINENFYKVTKFELGFYKMIENFDVNLSTNFNKRGLPLNCEIIIYEISDQLPPKLLNCFQTNKNHLSRATMLKNMLLVPQNLENEASIYFGFHNTPRMGHGVFQKWEKTETHWIQIESKGTWKS